MAISLASVAFALLLAIVAAKTEPGKPQGAFLAVSMQPEKIARTLVSVQDEWKAQAFAFASCDAASNSTSADDGDLLLVDCHRAPNAFAKSCETVVQAVTQGSSGDRDEIEEYMNDICSQEILRGLRQTRCQGLTNSILSVMSSNTFSNRVALDAKKKKICLDMWSKSLFEERAQRDAEDKQAIGEAKRNADAKVKAEEAAKKRAEDEAKAAEDELRRRGAQDSAHAAKATADAAAAKARAEAKAKADEQSAQGRAQAVQSGKSQKPAVNASAKHTVKAMLQTAVEPEGDGGYMDKYITEARDTSRAAWFSAGATSQDPSGRLASAAAMRSSSALADDSSNDMSAQRPHVLVAHASTGAPVRGAVMSVKLDSELQQAKELKRGGGSNHLRAQP